MPEPSVRQWVTQYTVNATAGTDPFDDNLFDIHVHQAIQMDGTEKWAVRRMGRCLDAAGEWDYESIPSERTDEWLATHRHDLATALRLAQEAAPNLTVNGYRPDWTRVTGEGEDRG